MFPCKTTMLTCIFFFTNYCSSLTIVAEISCGELIDKITILEIKAERITDPVKLNNIKKELTILLKTVHEVLDMSPALLMLKNELHQINELLWDIENALREKEYKKCFDQEFIELARSVYCTNDKRYLLKQKINILLDSRIIEEKSHTNYAHVFA